MVLERWDLSTGQRTIVPVIDEQENPIEVNRDRSIFHYKGVQVGDEYRFISELRPGTWTRLMVAVMRLAGGPDLGILLGSGP